MRPLVNELPFVTFYWLLAWTLLAIGEGDLDSSVGWVAFGIAIAATVGLGVIVRRGLRARPAVERALAEGLGARWPSDRDAESEARSREQLPLVRILLAPLLMRRRDVERTANISYGDAGRRNLLDVYRSRSHGLRGPVLIHLHGGHFATGSKEREARPLLYRFASQGWMCVSANYRLGPAARFPDYLVDAKKVIAWAHEHAAEYGADRMRVFVAGSSAGAHLAAMAALTPREAAFQPGFERADTSITAAICLGGYYGDASADTPSSPLGRARHGAPPFFLAHGERDMLTLMKGARLLAEELRNASSNPVVYAVLPGGQHAFDLFHSIRFEIVIDGIESFAAWVMAREDLHCLADIGRAGE